MPAEALAVHRAVARFVTAHASAPLAAAIALHLDTWDAPLAEVDPIGAVLAPRVARAFGSRSDAAVAAATWSFFLGIDLLDNVADRELDPGWAARHGAVAPDLATLAALALIQSAPPMLLAEAALPADVRGALAELFGSSCWTMIEGQLRDVTGVAEPGTAAVEATIEKKSGFHARLFAVAGALAARADVSITDDRVRAIGDFAVALGTAGELSSELADLFGGRSSRDVLNGKRTWPMVRALERLAEKSPEARARLVALLDAPEARGEAPEPHAGRLRAIQALLAEGEAPLLTTLRIEVFLARARRALRAAAPADPAPLEELLDLLSPLAEIARKAKAAR